jgi:hypothetical protein
LDGSTVIAAGVSPTATVHTISFVLLFITDTIIVS